jgi:CPA2 family monovalent cation:H+ antiporter-2
MPHDVTLIATFAVGFVLAFIFGTIANKLRLPPLVGYLVAGVVIGRFASDMVATTSIAGQLADIGVILLMFGVGLHFSVADLMAVRRIVLIGPLVQIAVATAIGTAMATMWGWSIGGGIVSASACRSRARWSCSRGWRSATRSPSPTAASRSAGTSSRISRWCWCSCCCRPGRGNGGKVPGGGTAEGGSLAWSLFITLVKVGAFGAIVLVGGPRALPWLLRQVARTGSRELFTLAVLTLSIGIAFGPPRLSASRSPSARSSPASCSTSRTCRTRRQRTRYRSRTRSPCCSSCRWECCSIP